MSASVLFGTPMRSEYVCSRSSVEHDVAATHHLTILGALLDVHHEFLLLLFQLGALSVQLALCFLQRPLVLPEPFGWRLGAPKEGFDDGCHVSVGRDALRIGE